MNFASLTFLIFFAAVMLLNLIVKNGRVRQIILLGASYVFYGWWDWRFCGLMLALTAVAYFTAIGMDRHPDRKKPLLAVGVIVPLAVLFFFKYMNFFVDSFCAVMGIARAGALRIILPVGISFYTFQSLSYTIDAYRGKVAISRDFLKFALYISFFPQLVAGPIVKAADFLPQLDEDRRPTARGISQGLNIFLWGLMKKAMLADQLSVFVDAIYAAPKAYSTVTIALAIIAYAMQIYFDFSGYSDMATGCARALGYDLARNFDLPYISRNVTEFWRRWHISLSTWLKEYLYIPLGGNRRGRARSYINLMLTMLLGGLWHGAGVNFILWGGLHGAALCVHKLWARHHAPSGSRIAHIIAILLTFAFTSLCWVFFRAQTLSQAMEILSRLFFPSEGVTHIYTWAVAAPILLLIGTIWCAARHRDADGTIHGALPDLRIGTFWGTLALALLAGFTFIMMYTGENPFIYFQF